MRLYRIWILSILVALTGCAVKKQPRSPANVIWDSKQQLWISPGALYEQLPGTQFIVIGELHESPKMRNKLLQTLDYLRLKNSLNVLFIDAFSSNTSSDLQLFSDHFKSAPPPVADYFRPVVLWAEQNEIILQGAATPKEKLGSLKSREGQDWVEKRTSGVLSREQQQALYDILVESHPSLTEQPRQGQYFLAAHKLQDDFMARLMVATQQNTVLLTRAFHARKDLGIEPYIRNLKPESTIVSMLMLGLADDQDAPDELVNSLKNDYDFIWFQQPDKHLLLAPKDQSESHTSTEQQ